MGVRGAGLEAEDEAESGVCEFGGVELGVEEPEGAELCAHAPTLPASNKTRSPLRIRLF